MSGEPTRMLERIVPPRVAVVEAFSDPPDARLFPEEEALMARAAPKRRRQFTTARWCARGALRALGAPSAPILPGARGAPQWPPGIVGSMTHCDGYRAAALAWAGEVVSIGIDAEPHHGLSEGVLRLIARPEERAHLADLSAGHPAVCWDLLLFSAKESVFKAWFPLTERWLDFQEAALTIVPADQSFTARLLVDGPVVDGRAVSVFAGRWTVEQGLAVTSVVVTRSGADADAGAATRVMRSTDVGAGR